jgi:rhodanese-related sulfurtransferase
MTDIDSSQSPFFLIEEDISCLALSALIEDGVKMTLIDVRQEWEIDICKINNSIHIPLPKLEDSLNTIPTDQPLITICHHGVRSRQAMMILKRNGFNNVASLIGGVDIWAKEIDQIMAQY